MPLAAYVGGITNALTAANWTRINYGNIFAIPDNPCLRPRIGIRRGIGRKHPTHERFMLFGFACFDGVWPFHYGNMAHEGQKRKGAMSGISCGCILRHWGQADVQHDYNAFGS